MKVIYSTGRMHNSSFALIVSLAFLWTMCETRIGRCQESTMPDARSVVKEITVRVVEKGATTTISTGYFINREGFVLTSGLDSDDSTAGRIVLETERTVGFVEIARTNELRLLLIKDVFDVPKIVVPKLASIEKVEEGDQIWTRSGIGPGSLVTRVGYIAYVPKPKSGSFIVQAPMSPGTAGAPIVDLDGLMVGALYSGIKHDPTNFGIMRHSQLILQDLRQLPEILSAADILSPSLTLKSETLDCKLANDDGTVIDGRVTEVNSYRIEDRIDLDFALLAAKERGVSKIELSGINHDGIEWTKQFDSSDGTTIEPAFRIPPSK